MDSTESGHALKIADGHHHWLFFEGDAATNQKPTSTTKVIQMVATSYNNDYAEFCA
jgi:hypothetical protein